MQHSHIESDSPFPTDLAAIHVPLTSFCSPLKIDGHQLAYSSASIEHECTSPWVCAASAALHQKHSKGPPHNSLAKSLTPVLSISPLTNLFSVFACSPCLKPRITHHPNVRARWIGYTYLSPLDLTDRCAHLTLYSCSGTMIPSAHVIHTGEYAKKNISAHRLLGLAANHKLSPFDEGSKSLDADLSLAFISQWLLKASLHVGGKPRGADQLRCRYLRRNPQSAGEISRRLSQSQRKTKGSCVKLQIWHAWPLAAVCAAVLDFTESPVSVSQFNGPGLSGTFVRLHSHALRAIRRAVGERRCDKTAVALELD